ncbi:MAG: hypothetical protein IPH07_15550 [Deltaproteobacteria bacterium]|nr:hypothetical protein [Deltaproteobacteria bacterium]MBK8239194.1 hypothetical protein [Deltaproteobacteria bacterium]MBP7288652.1 hypothetical protein [Nannocystaceae bacterium]
MRRAALLPSLLLLSFVLPSAAAAREAPGYHPYLPKDHGSEARILTLDVHALLASPRRHTPAPQPDLAVLDRVAAGELPADVDGENPRGPMPDGWVQRGGMVLPREIDEGRLQVEPDTIFAVEDIPGNEYPRKHTLFLNFNGGELKPGADNSTENTSALARAGNYPVWDQGQQKAISIAQAVQADFAPFGVAVVYETRPGDVAPYTMEMMGGDWTDTNIDSPAGGVAPGADCGALGQRHVVYAFNSFSAVQMANTASQEAGHAYGLDHTFDCNSVMSYCGGGDGSFRTECAGLCEAQCQGPNSAGCQLTHEMFCGDGSLQQNDFDEMTWIFGGNEPDMEPPVATIESPTDGQAFEVGADVQFRAVVDDNYGGYGWKFVFYKDGEVIYDQIDFDREVDDQYRAAVNLAGLDAGTYELHIEVHDQFAHVTEDVVTIQVGDAAGTDGGTNATGAGTDGGGSASGGSDGGADSGTDGGSDGAASDTAMGSGDDGSVDRGCGCDAGGPAGPSTAAAWLLAVVAGTARRRARARSGR